MKFFKRWLTSLRRLLDAPTLVEAAVANFPKTDEEAFRRDARAVEGDWRQVAADLDAAREAVLKGRLLVVNYDYHRHEVLEEDHHSGLGSGERTRSGLLRCRRRFSVHGSDMLLAWAVAITCPNCIAARARLN